MYLFDQIDTRLLGFFCLLLSQGVTTADVFKTFGTTTEFVFPLKISECGSWTTQLDTRNKRAVKSKCRRWKCMKPLLRHSHHSHHSSDPVSRQGRSTFPLLAGNPPLGVQLLTSFWSHRSDISLITTCRILNEWEESHTCRFDKSRSHQAPPKPEPK